jgi:hypothetical protein
MGSRDHMFADIDRMDADAWAAHLADSAVMKFGNGDPVHGRQACRDALAGFYDTIAGVSHEIVEQWRPDGAAIVESNVTYRKQPVLGLWLCVSTLLVAGTPAQFGRSRICRDSRSPG